MVQISDLFVAPDLLPSNFGGFVQLIFLMACYAFFLKTGSEFISNGSELLLLVPSIAGIVGSVVLPVLGAVPDGAIVLFSGMGPDAQEQLNIGVGALAGSSIMLITLPWAMCILAGRVDLDSNGDPIYKKPSGAPKTWTKLTPNAGLMHTLFHSGIPIDRPMRINAAILVVTTAAYLLIQVPSFFLGCGEGEDCTRAHSEKWWAFGGFLFAVLSFIAYLIYQVRVGGKEEHHVLLITQKVGHQVSHGHVSVAAAFFAFMASEGALEEGFDLGPETASSRALLGDQVHPAGHGEVAIGIHSQASQADLKKLRAERRMKHMLKRFFVRYDTDSSGLIDQSELSHLLADIGCHLAPAAVSELFKQMDTSNDSFVDFEEFTQAVMIIIKNPEFIRSIEEKAKQDRPATEEERAERKAKGLSQQGSVANLNLNVSNGNGSSSANGAVSSPTNDDEHSIGGSPLQRAQFPGSSVGLKPLNGSDEDGGADDGSDVESDEEEEEVPEDLRSLSQEEQQSAIKLRAAWMMALGTFMILLFSDPMVDCLSSLGDRIHVPGFYVAFLLAPLAANASELMAAVNYATKKTPSSITISITSLEGSGTMNNTFCLLIFLALIFFKDLVWQFSAETIAIVLVEFIVALMTLLKKTFRGIDAIILLSLYPLSMGLVAALENAAGLN